MKKSATGTISPQISQKKHFNIVPVKSKNQEDKPWKANNNNNNTSRIAVSVSKVDSNLQRNNNNNVSKVEKVIRFQSPENGRPALDNIKVSFFSYQSKDL